MLSAEECKALLDCDILFFEDCLILDCNINKLEAPALNMTIMLSESQKRLMVCLLKKSIARERLLISSGMKIIRGLATTTIIS